MIKDVDQALALGMQLGAPLPIAGVSRSLLQVGANLIGKEARLEDMIGLIEAMAGTRFAEVAVEQAGPSAVTKTPVGMPSIGYVGLGAMGAALARRLLACGCKVHVYDVRVENVRDLAAEGAFPSADLPSLARASDVILICVPTSEVVREVLFGPNGLSGGLAAGKIVVDQTTGDPAATRSMAAELEALGVRMVDALCPGGPLALWGGTIVTFCGGTEDAFAEVRPLLALTGPTVVHFGRQEAAMSQS
jgi:3-hydroxyisobutyrate dehydrogenase